MPRLLIADSDDEDEGPYSPSPEYVPGRDASSGNQTHETTSTDPLFFQNVFEEHSAASRGRQVDERPKESSSVNPSGRGRAEDSGVSLLTSVTEPGARTGRISVAQSTNEFTQVTTPREGADPWEISSSPGPRGEETQAADSRRQRVPLPNLTSKDAVEDELTADDGNRRRKRRKREGRHPMGGQALGIIDISSGSDPDNEASPQPKSRRRKDASLLVAPPQLSESQRKQYEAVPTQSTAPLSSSTRRRIQTEKAPSSGTTTNINTPRSDPALEAGMSDTPRPGSSRARRMTSSPGIYSSPDIIAAHVSPKSISKKRAVEDWEEHNGDEFPRERYDESDNDPDFGAPVKHSPKKRRGRPKKSQALKGEPNPQADIVKDEEVIQHPPEKKKKRGRPKKEPKISPPSEQVKEEVPSQDSMVDKGNEEPPESCTEEQGPYNAVAENEIESRGAQIELTEAVTKLEAKETVEKPVTKADPKPTPSKIGGPLYRVGLSKKSRIAPLLKIVRK